MKNGTSRFLPGGLPAPRPEDVFFGGEVLIFRNPAGEVFSERDRWVLAEPWQTRDDMRAAYVKAARKEAVLAETQTFAWHRTFGYLSPLPEHAGTGLVLRADMHLEALHLIGDLPPVLSALNALRFGADGFDVDGLKAAGHFFDVYTRAGMGVTEEELLVRATRVFGDLAQQEMNARIRLLRELPRTFEDAVSRALAILKNCRLLSPWELLDIVSPLRLAAIMGFLDGFTREMADALMRRQIATVDNLPDTAAGDRMRDERDAALADEINKRFARITWSPRAKEYFS